MLQPLRERSEIPLCNGVLVIDQECIDCGVCGPECPVEAIKQDTQLGLERWLAVNAEYAKNWPNISQKKEAPPDAKEFNGMKKKFEKYLSPNTRSGY